MPASFASHGVSSKLSTTAIDSTMYSGKILAGPIPLSFSRPGLRAENVDLNDRFIAIPLPRSSLLSRAIL
jgi:hypothetical protein